MAKRPNKHKKSSTFETIGFLILLWIIYQYSRQLIIVGGIILLLIILYAIIKTVDAHALKKSQANANSAPINMLQVERNIEILTDSLNLVNDSNNLDTVLHRYDMAVEALKKLSVFTNQELTGMGFHIHESPSDTLQRMQDKKIQLFNQAIARNLEHEIASVVKNETKVKKITNFRSRYENHPSLSPENKSFLNDQCNFNVSKYAPQSYTQINSIDHTIKNVARVTDGTLTYHVQPDDFMKEFYELSQRIDSGKDIYEKIDACEKSFPLLKEYCRFCIENDNGELPPHINCRDLGPELYMRLGRWQDVERVIQICTEANAYYPNNDDGIWTYYTNYKRIADLAVSYIRNNPGCLQNRIYNELNVVDDDRENLKHFLRCSLQIKKVKHGNTNESYCI